MLAPETVLQNRYRIIRQLGQGGMGAVYEALDERLDATVALKETLFADERLRKQFEREARLLARMHHPALPRVSDHFSEGGGQFLVMQYIAGDDLARMITGKQGPFPPDQVLNWGDQLLDALDYLHTQDPQIVHRDIKPQNLKLTSRGQIILLDFGLAKGQAGGISIVTTSPSIFGYTPNYAPLEQIQGLGTDARTDIYALSATLYHLITAVKPPDALTRAAALVNGQPDPLRPANEINGNIGPEVASVLARGMSQNREQRFATAAAMRSALKETGEAATLATRSEAVTVLKPPAATLTEDPGTVKQTEMKAAETTVVRGLAASGKRRLSPWAVGAAALVLVGVVFGVFYAYQHRNNSTTTTTPASASDATENKSAETSAPSAAPTSSTETAGNSPKEEKKSEISTQRGNTPEAAKKNVKASVSNEKISNKPAHSGHVQVAVPSPPATQEPESDESEPPRANPPRRQMGGASVRNLPNGTQIVTSPDGTRVVTYPDGTSRVYRPGEKIIRRRKLP
jgi:eukaryotic-like serine/threonine-protein kinase